jgi:hypothetical protein
MERRGVRYTIRIGIEPSAWSVTIHPGGIESAVKRVYGTREDAEAEAHSMIDRWLKEQRAAHRKQSNQT